MEVDLGFMCNYVVTSYKIFVGAVYKIETDLSGLGGHLSGWPVLFIDRRKLSRFAFHNTTFLFTSVADIFLTASAAEEPFLKSNMGKLSQYARNRVISLRIANNSIVNIVRILQEEDGIKTSRTSVSSFIARYQRTGSIDDAQRSGRKSILSEEDVSFIDEKMKANDELTSGEIQKLLRDERGVKISTSTIRNVRRKKLGWKHEKA